MPENITDDDDALLKRLPAAIARLQTVETTAEAELDWNDQPTGFVRVSAFEWDDITDVRDAYLASLEEQRRNAEMDAAFEQARVDAKKLIEHLDRHV